MTALSAYNDVTGDEIYKVKNNGAYSSELAVGYGDLIQAKINIDPTYEPTKKMPVALSVMSTPVSTRLTRTQRLLLIMQSVLQQMQTSQLSSDLTSSLV